MTADYIIRTDHAELKLTTDGQITQEEWDTLTASLTALYVVVVPEGTQTVTRLLEELNEPGEDEISRMTQAATSSWNAPEMSLNTTTHVGPLDASVMGMRLHAGDEARVTPSHQEAHVGTMHRWALETRGSGSAFGADSYVCGHGGCNAHVSVTKAF